MRRSGLLHVAIVGTSLDILGGQGVQACRLIEGLEATGIRVTFIPINPRFPSALRGFGGFLSCGRFSIS